MSAHHIARPRSLSPSFIRKPLNACALPLFVTLLALLPTISVHAAAVVTASTTVVNPGAGGANTADISATFSLRQAAQGGVAGGRDGRADREFLGRRCPLR